MTKMQKFVKERGTLALSIAADCYLVSLYGRTSEQRAAAQRQWMEIKSEWAEAAVEVANSISTEIIQNVSCDCIECQLIDKIMTEVDS